FSLYICLIACSEKSTYQQLFKELNAAAVSMGRTWKPRSNYGVISISVSAYIDVSNHLGLATAYLQDESVRSCCRKLMGLPLLPIQEVETSFYNLRATADPTVKQQLRELFLYFDEY
ncbi:unnamed protein product, partial [Rotaria socialis]